VLRAKAEKHNPPFAKAHVNQRRATGNELWPEQPA
jgi:hypothetical protein